MAFREMFGSVIVSTRMNSKTEMCLIQERELMPRVSTRRARLGKIAMGWPGFDEQLVHRRSPISGAHKHIVLEVSHDPSTRRTINGNSCPWKFFGLLRTERCSAVICSHCA